jgi:hypothetical protein
MTQGQFGAINLLLFCLFLPIYWAWGGADQNLVVGVLLVILVGATGWFATAFLLLAAINRLLRRKSR